MRKIPYVPTILTLITLVPIVAYMYMLWVSASRPYESRVRQTYNYVTLPSTISSLPTSQELIFQPITRLPEYTPSEEAGFEEEDLVLSSVDGSAYSSVEKSSGPTVLDDNLIWRYKKENTRRIEMSVDGHRGLILDHIAGTTQCAPTFIDVNKDGYVNSNGEYVSNDSYAFSGGAPVDCDFRLK